MSPLMTYLESLNGYICKQFFDYIQASESLFDLVQGGFFYCSVL